MFLSVTYKYFAISLIWQNSFLITVHFALQFLDMIAGNVLVILHHLVNDSVRSQLNDTVGHGFNKLMVVAGE